MIPFELRRAKTTNQTVTWPNCCCVSFFVWFKSIKFRKWPYLADGAKCETQHQRPAAVKLQFWVDYCQNTNFWLVSGAKWRTELDFKFGLDKSGSSHNNGSNNITDSAPTNQLYPMDRLHFVSIVGIAHKVFISTLWVGRRIQWQYPLNKWRKCCENKRRNTNIRRPNKKMLAYRENCNEITKIKKIHRVFWESLHKKKH